MILGTLRAIARFFKLNKQVRTRETGVTPWISRRPLPNVRRTQLSQLFADLNSTNLPSLNIKSSGNADFLDDSSRSISSRVDE